LDERFPGPDRFQFWLCDKKLSEVFVARVSYMISAFGCGFNRSLQHLVSIRREEEVAVEEIPTEDSLHRNRQSADVGSLVATALVATVGDARQYHRGRQMAAAIGLTPRQHSSEGKDRLLGISKRGDVYLRSMLIHGARAVASQAKHRDDRLSRWVIGIAQRRHPNVAAVALANKTARMAWTMLRNETDYDPDFAMS
jgi:transposase